jgi:hypothetical protein
MSPPPGPDLLSQIPAQLQPVFTNGFHRAFSAALGGSMSLGVGAPIVASLSVVLLRDLALRYAPRRAGGWCAGHDAAQADGPVDQSASQPIAGQPSADAVEPAAKGALEG